MVPPPFNKNVKTRVGEKFLKLVEKHFPKGHPLRQIINPSTIKISYSCTPNMSAVISAQNIKILQKEEEGRPCNCGKKVCPLGGKCLLKNIVYQATVTSSDNKTEHYVGLCSTTFKERLSTHKYTFNHEREEKRTELSKYIWKLKRKKLTYNIQYKFLDRASPYSPSTGVCNLCVREKFYINFHPEIATINKKDELNGFCLHQSKLLLDNT